MNLTPEFIKKYKIYKTPFLIVDLGLLKKKYKTIKESIKGVEVFYAMKANDHKEILKTIHREGSSFEISSLNELKDLLKLGVSPSKIMCLNPIKNPEFLKYMDRKGIYLMAFDSTDEVDKILQYAPKSELILRINVTNEGSDWPLTKKFGVDAPEALGLLHYAKQKGLKPIGLTFHVGSQCLNKNNWASALYLCDDIWNQAKKEGIEMSLISLGGGIPVQHTKLIPTVREIGEVINKALRQNFHVSKGKLRITIEPGRGLVGDAAIMVSSVVGKAKRITEEWVYLDVGVFNGLMETVERFKYELRTELKRPLKQVTVAGPSCDSVDITFKNIQLPEVKMGERVYIMNAGAYTTVYAAPFNGFNIPKVYFI